MRLLSTQYENMESHIRKLLRFFFMNCDDTLKAALWRQQ